MVRVKLVGLEGAGEQQSDLIARACAHLESALNHPQFPARVASASYKQTRFRGADGAVVSVPPEEIWDYIRSGRERGAQDDGEIQVSIRLARIRRGVFGSTYPGRLPWRTAYWFVNECVEQNDVVSLARHIIHEWLHVAGFFHYPNNKARGDVPYNVGAIVVALLKEQKSLWESPALAALFEEGACGEEGEQAGEGDDPDADARQL